MKKQRTWNVTINYVPFESEAQRDQHYDMWIDCVIEGQKNKIAAEQQQRRESDQEDET